MVKKISVKVKPGSKRNLVELTAEREYTVRVKEKAIEGRANDAVIRLISEHFDTPRSRIKIIKGANSRNKVMEIF